MRKGTKKQEELCDPSICDECTYIGNGCFLCLKKGYENPVAVMDDWVATDDYMWCGGNNE